MARTPAFPPSHYEAILGPRGNLNLETCDKVALRKWLVSKGVPGKHVDTLKGWQKVNAYNKDDSVVFGVNWQKAQATKHGIVETDEDDSDNGVTFADEKTETATDSTPSRDSDLETLRRILGASCDENKVRDIVKKEVKNLESALLELVSTNTIRVEIKNQDGETHKVEGHCHPKLPTLLKAMTARQANGFHPNIMLVGPTGSGKTHSFLQACKAMNLEPRTNGAISMDHQLIGYKDANGNYHSTPFREAFGGPFGYLFDEVDSSDNSPLLALAGALANGSMSFPDGIVERHIDSVIVAAGNTWGLGGNADFVGRNKLDGAIRSRFPIRIQWPIDEALERNICGNVDWACRVQKARANALRAGLKVIIDPRMSQAGAALIANGMTMDEAAEITYLADLSPEQRDIVEP